MEPGVAGIDHQDEGVQCDGSAGDEFCVWRQLGLDVGDDFGLGANGKLGEPCISARGDVAGGSGAAGLSSAG